jgi:hypothetical protein
MAGIKKDVHWQDTHCYFSLYITKKNRAGIRKWAKTRLQANGKQHSMSSIVNEYLEKFIKECEDEAAKRLCDCQSKD